MRRPWARNYCSGSAASSSGVARRHMLRTVTPIRFTDHPATRHIARLAGPPRAARRALPEPASWRVGSSSANRAHEVDVLRFPGKEVGVRLPGQLATTAEVEADRGTARDCGNVQHLCAGLDGDLLSFLPQRGRDTPPSMAPTHIEEGTPCQPGLERTLDDGQTQDIFPIERSQESCATLDDGPAELDHAVNAELPRTIPTPCWYVQVHGPTDQHPFCGAVFHIHMLRTVDLADQTELVGPEPPDLPGSTHIEIVPARANRPRSPNPGR